MKKFFKKHSGLIIALLAIVGAAIYVVMQLAKAGNTPEDKQLSAFGGADHPAAITEMTDLVRHHPERVIKVHRQIAAGSAFAERIAIEAKNDGDKLGSLWSITTQTDDQSLMAVITETNHALEGAHRGVIPVVNEALQGSAGTVEAHAGPANNNESWGPKIVEWVLILGGGFLVWRMLNKSGGFGRPNGLSDKSPAKMMEELNTTGALTLDQIAGLDETLDEIKEWASDIKDKEEIIALGGSPDRGVLLVGPPGTGKTATARAIGMWIGIPVFYLNGSDFVKMYVGVGADNVNKLFAEARAARDAHPTKTCLIVVDEADALLRNRAQSGGPGGGNDERESTLNKWLGEMDGMDSNEGLYFIAMTNRPEMIDPAALRPGRFGRRFTINYADAHGREEQLRVHAVGVPLADDVDLRELAEDLPNNTSGAAIRSILRSRAPSMVRKLARQSGAQAKKITREALKLVAEELEFGAPISPARSARMPEEFKRIVRKHETGHLTVALAMYDRTLAGPLPWGHKPLVISAMGPAGTGGFVKTAIGSNMSLLSETELRAHMMLGFGGTLAELNFIGNKTVGNQGDIQMINRAADEMVTKFDMAGDDEIPAIAVPRRSGSQFLGGEDMAQYDGLSDESMTQIDRAKARLIRDAKAKARAILLLHRGFYDYFHPKLEEAKGLRMYTAEILEHWANYKKLNPMEMPDWWTNDELFFAMWDDRAKNPPTLADLEKLRGLAVEYPALAGLPVLQRRPNN